MNTSLGNRMVPAQRPAADDGELAQQQALRWIVGLLKDLGIPFQAAGGLAARAHGARRPLVDLDFYVPTGRLAEVADAAERHVVRAPAPHRDDHWDLVFMKLEYKGCEIELGGADGARYYDRANDCWRAADIDFSSSETRPALGIRVPTMPRDRLELYKAALARDVDRRDLAEMAAAAPEHLFVYGSLAPGEANEHVLAGIEGEWAPAHVRGRLVDAGWGAEIGHPALVLDDRAGTVAGRIFSAPGMARLWPELDEFEGSGYRRVPVTARLEDGTCVDAFVYVLHEPSS